MVSALCVTSLQTLAELSETPSAELDEYAAKRGHTHYAQLHPFISASPDTIWILVHWSIKYSRDDVEEFFRENYGGVPRNVVLWI